MESSDGSDPTEHREMSGQPSHNALPEDISALLKMLEDKDSFARKQACKALGNLPPDELAKHSSDLLNLKIPLDEDFSVRWAVCFVFCKLPPDELARCSKGLLKMLKDKDASVRWAVSCVLGKLTADELAKHSSALLKMLEDKDSLVRSAACEALGKLPPDELATHSSALLKMLEDKDSLVRTAAQDALRKVSACELASRTSDVLKMLNCSDETLQSIARDSLEQFSPGDVAKHSSELQKVLEIADSPVPVVKTVCEKLGELSPEDLANAADLPQKLKMHDSDASTQLREMCADSVKMMSVEAKVDNDCGVLVLASEQSPQVEIAKHLDKEVPDTYGVQLPKAQTLCSNVFKVTQDALLDKPTVSTLLIPIEAGANVAFCSNTDSPSRSHWKEIPATFSERYMEVRLSSSSVQSEKSQNSLYVFAGVRTEPCAERAVQCYRWLCSSLAPSIQRTISEFAGAGSGNRRHLLLSANFKSEEFMNSLKTIKASLKDRGVPTEVAVGGVGPGQIFMPFMQTMKKLHEAKMMVAFCTEYYGAKTAGYGTFQELKYACDKKLPIISVQYDNMYPPQPPNSKEGRIQNEYVFSLPTILRRINSWKDEIEQPAEHIADELAKAWRYYNGLPDTE